MTESKKDQILEKVRKLLALAGDNPSEVEATLAAQKAQELLTKYKLDMTEVEIEAKADESVEQDTMYFESGIRVNTWKVILAQAVAKANNCQVFTQSGYRKEGMRIAGHYIQGPEVKGKCIIVGKQSNAAAARYLAMALINTVERMSKWYVKQNGGGKTAGNNFRLGMVAKIEARLEEAQRVVRKAPGVSTVALARLDSEDRQVETYIRLNLDLKQKKAKFSRDEDEDAYGAGQNAGEKVGLGNDGGALNRGAKALK